MTVMAPDARPQRAEDRTTLCVVAGCFLLTVVLGAFSNGVHHDDDLTHFLMARWSAWFPSYLLHVWGRPALTIPLATVSWLGDADLAWHAARLLSSLVTAVTAILAARFGTNIGVRPAWLVALCCYAQPLGAVLAYTTLSENFAAFYLMAAVYLRLRGRLIAASAVFSLALLTRHEAVILLPVWAFAILRTQTGWSRRLLAVGVALSAPLMHNVLHRLVFGVWPFTMFLQPHGSTEYLAQGPLAYVPDVIYAVTPAIFSLAVIGGISLWRRGIVLPPALAATFLLTHLTIKGLGLYASGGYGRFMIAVAPFMALLAVAGLQRLTAECRKPGGRALGWLVVALVWAGAWMACETELRAGRIFRPEIVWLWAARLASVTFILAALFVFLAGRNRPLRYLSWVCALSALGMWTVQWFAIVRPLRRTWDQALVQDVTAWLTQQGIAGGPIFATNPWFPFFLDHVENPRAHKDAALLASMPVSTILIWDSLYSDNDYHGLALDEYLNDERYELLRRFESSPRANCKVVVFRKIAETPVLARMRASYPRPLVDQREAVRGIYYLNAASP